MASPQPLPYTKYSNELLEAKTHIRISGEENQIWEVILRQSYGYNKKNDIISLSQFVLKTGLKKSSICRAIKKLLDKNMINKKDNPNSVTYNIQKNYDEWKPLTKKLTLTKKIIPLTKKLTNVDKKDNPISIITKEKRQYTKEKTLVPEYLELAKLLQKEILKNIPTFKTTDIQLKQWSDVVRLMIEQDDRTLEQIKFLIIWAQQDDFWFKNILSMSKLRKQFDKLTAETKGNSYKQPTKPQGGFSSGKQLSNTVTDFPL